jgi:predicted CoA-binding protein
MVGASPNWNRPSYFVMRYLQRKGFRVIPVNPRALDAPILGERTYPDLESIDVPVDVVDVFRRPEEVPAIARSAVAIGAGTLWLQLGIRSDEAATLAGIAGLTVVQDRCMKIEYGRLGGELAWNGINTRMISSRRRRLLG